jgi:hypothetical protein
MSVKIMSSSALVHSASTIQIKHEQSLGIKCIKHWSELDTALQKQNQKPGVDLFDMHHSGTAITLPCSKMIESISLLDSDDDSSNEDVDYIVDEFENSQLQPRLCGTPTSISHSYLPQIPKTFVDLSANQKKVMQMPNMSHKAPSSRVHKPAATLAMHDFAVYPAGKNENECASPVLRKGFSRASKQPIVIHRGLPSTAVCPDLSPISFKLLCKNEMPRPIARVPLSGSPLKHPFRIASKKYPPSGNVEAAVQIFKVDVSPPSFPQLYDSKTFKINRMHSKWERTATTTPVAPVTALQITNPDLPPHGELHANEYWGQVKLFEEASRFVTQPPRDYGLIIHLALNRSKQSPT